MHLTVLSVVFCFRALGKASKMAVWIKKFTNGFSVSQIRVDNRFHAFIQFLWSVVFEVQKKNEILFIQIQQRSLSCELIFSHNSECPPPQQNRSKLFDSRTFWLLIFRHKISHREQNISKSSNIGPS